MERIVLLNVPVGTEMFHSIMKWQRALKLAVRQTSWQWRYVIDLDESGLDRPKRRMVSSFDTRFFDARKSIRKRFRLVVGLRDQCQGHCNL